MIECLNLKKANCKNCYKCIRFCPVKSIRFSGSQALIDKDECILCGNCYVVCPQNAREIHDETEKAKVLLQCGSPVVASIAPSFISYFDGVGIESLRKALLKLGFSDVQETAIGATHVKTEYERIMREEQPDIILSSCCHSVNLLIQKYHPTCLPFLADVVTPVQAHAREIRRVIPDAKIVFIGPCIAKKDEAEQSDIIDAVLTFEQLKAWLDYRQISLEHEVDSTEESKARFFPTTGGILKTMDTAAYDYKFIAIDGMKQCVSALKDIEAGRIHHAFIEMSACIGSCVGGPIMQKAQKSPVFSNLVIADYAGKKDFNIKPLDELAIRTHFTPFKKTRKEPTEAEITEILHQMGKYKPADELNCGTCGYATCREKAIAVFQGKAEVSMCLPFLKDKAESLTDTIFKNSPNGLIVLNEKLEVQQLNPAAQILLNVRRVSDIQGSPVVRILDPKPFVDILETGNNIINQRTYLAEYNRYVEQSILYDKACHAIVCFMRDVTEEQTARERKERISSETIEVADKVVDKQMRIVQEIASLLVETSAETKIALSKLKESISHE